VTGSRDRRLPAFGSKASQFFKRVGGRVVAQATHLGDAPGLSDLIGSVKVMLDAYDEGKIDRLYLPTTIS
jgi:F-type H+-transporting ATPase subunit gamma